MEIIVQWSGGKDSQASLIHTVKKFGNKSVMAVFCDTGWEHELTYQHIENVCNDLGVDLVIIKSKIYKDFIDLAKQHKRFPSTKARFCTSKLKNEPFIDFILDVIQDDVLVIQGIRADESLSRSKMEKQCTLFKYYFEPYNIDKHGRKEYHNYRSKEVKIYCSKYATEIERPVFEWTANDTLNYILDNGFNPNPLYYHGASRVGCYPCIMCRHGEIKNIILRDLSRLDLIVEAEKYVGRSFFPPNYIPKRYQSGKDINGKSYPTILDVKKYVMEIEKGHEKRDENKEGCMSYYGICE